TPVPAATSTGGEAGPAPRVPLAVIAGLATAGVVLLGFAGVALLLLRRI
ncbi:MAG: hypothetical protein HYX99_01755, partial [Chloroflexi bacterium]|nr:hypothetical protein [Chloroflexota bacterium]